MKKLFAFAAIICAMNVAAQKTERTIISDPLVSPLSAYPTRPDVKEIGKPNNGNASQHVSGAYVTINRTRQPALKPSPAALSANNTQQKTIVIINNKIYSTNDDAFKHLDSTQILDMKVVKDEQSKTGVQSVIIIRTKE